MATHTIIIDNKSDKTKYLLGLIKEMAKEEEHIVIDPSPNKETKNAISEARKGKVSKAKDADDLFEQLGK